MERNWNTWIQWFGWVGGWILLTIYSSYFLMLTLRNFTQSPSSYTNASYDGTMTVWKEQCSGADLRHLSWYWLIVNRNLELNKWLALFALCFLCVAFTVWHTVHCQLSGQSFKSFAHCLVRPAEIWPLLSLCWKSQLQTACVKQMCTSDLTYDPSCFTKSSNWEIDDSYVG